jgi:hypothetical protein
MRLWMIEPVAGRADTRWLDHPPWAEVVVRAQTAAQARLAAAEMEAGLVADSTPVGNESLEFRSGFEDEKLYRVRPLDPREVPDVSPQGPQEVLRATRAPASAQAGKD